MGDHAARAGAGPVAGRICLCRQAGIVRGAQSVFDGGETGGLVRGVGAEVRNEIMPARPTCDQCGTILPANAPQGLCPTCLVAMVLSLPTQDGGDKAETLTRSSGTRARPAGEEKAAPSSALADLRRFGDYE